MLNRPFPVPTLLAIALAAVLSGCSSTHEPAELATIEPTSQYDQRMQDSLGGQKYTESQILYMRRLNEFKDQIDSLERQKKALEASLSTTAYEQDINSGHAPSTEAGRMQEFQAATQASQARVAEEKSKATIRQSIIENDRDRAVLEAETRAAAEIEQLRTTTATLQAKAAAEKAESARTLEKQRFAMAVANAEAERKAAETVEEINARISEVKGQLAGLEASLAQAQKEHQRLADLSKQLQAPVAVASANEPGTDAKTEARIAEIKARLAKEKTEITTRARTEVAGITAGSEIMKASVVAPVVTGRAVYAGSYGEKPTTFVKAAPPQQKPLAKPFSAPVKQEAIATVSKFEPRISPVVIQRGSDTGSAMLAGGPVTTAVQSPAPIVVAPKSRMIYDVLYVYKDEGSWKKFQRYLEAYGINDYEPVHKDGSFYLYMGRFYDKLAAARRVDFLNRTTNTSHATVHPQEVAM